MGKARPPWLLPAALVSAIGLVTLAVSVGRAAPDERAHALLVAAITVVVLAVIVTAIVVPITRANHRRVRRVAQERPGWDLAAAWADGTLGDALRELGATKPLPQGSGDAIVLAWSGEGVELWDGGKPPVRLLALPWRDVVQVTGTRAQAGTMVMNGLAVTVHSGVALVLCPSRQLSGGIAGASELQVEQLADRLRAHATTH
ncbi:hypothetical protein [Cellulomonas sp. PhB150]|uniref:hypothetical protein n=1 Tax=Cellulomonas sp. PhB150 TaxID=2485188 RepID=UPI000F48C28F|nr:hypothetical protein [Cellulomonas sp. PhB150]ROS26158.1 hypothetical protein EDF34_2487 [Cellulomonas sp. PhB150]